MGDVIPIVRHGNFMHAQERVWRATIREKRHRALRKLAESCGDQKFAEFQDKWYWSRGFFNREPLNLFPPDEYHREIAAARTKKPATPVIKIFSLLFIMHLYFFK